jgi:hypothetical protein
MRLPPTSLHSHGLARLLAAAFLACCCSSGQAPPQSPSQAPPQALPPPRRPPIVTPSQARLTVIAAASQDAPRWKMKFLHDEARTRFSIVDLQFPSARRGLALGLVAEQSEGPFGGRERLSGAALTTSDGGEHWNWVKLKDQPVSSFFLNESVGWMAAAGGLWKTEESGASWTRISNQKGITQVWFLDEQHGYACGVPKKVWETTDGGKHWTKLAAVDKVQSREDSTSFNWIWFRGPQGMIIGDSRPPRRIRASVPLWADPDDPLRVREWPALTILLETSDSGKTWSTDSGSVFGRMSRLRAGPNTAWVGLMEYHDGMDYPSEVYSLSRGARGADLLFHAKDRQITDFWIVGKTLYVAGIQLPGKVAYSPVPGKVTVLRSTNMQNWEEFKVDYRAVAHDVIIAGSPDGHLWIATDNGMILKFN